MRGANHRVMLRRVAIICLAALAPCMVGCDDGHRSESRPILPIEEGPTTSSSSSGTGGGAGTGHMTAEPACTRDVAFRAAGLSFLEPTPPALASRLNDVGYGYDAHGLTVVLAAADGAPRVAVSATENVSGAHQFTGLSPVSVGAQLAAGGFESTEAQSEATMQLWVEGHFVGIELRNINLRARTLSECAEAWIFVDAVIPESAGGIDLGGATISELAGPTKGNADVAGLGWPVQIMFATESILFDFATMPEGQ